MTVFAPPAQTDRRTIAARVGLVLVGAVQLEIGIWGLISPHSLFERFPGAGHHWIAPLGSYNEHLLRDYAASEVGFGVLLIGAALWFSRRSVLVAGTAFLAATVPHLVYHLTTTRSFSTADNLASLGGFVLEIVLVLAAMAVAASSDRPTLVGERGRR